MCPAPSAGFLFLFFVRFVPSILPTFHLFVLHHVGSCLLAQWFASLVACSYTRVFLSMRRLRQGRRLGWDQSSGYTQTFVLAPGFKLVLHAAGWSPRSDRPSRSPTWTLNSWLSELFSKRFLGHDFAYDWGPVDMEADGSLGSPQSSTCKVASSSCQLCKHPHSIVGSSPCSAT